MEYTFEYAKAHFLELADLASAGEEVIITRPGKVSMALQLDPPSLKQDPAAYLAAETA